MNSSSEVSDDHIIQINQSHEQTPIATSTNSPAPKHESRGLNEMTPEELSSLKVDLTTHICRKECLKSKQIIEKCPDMVRMPLNDSGYTALHLAVSYGSREIVKELVKRMRPEDMLIPNSDGDTALHLAVKIGRGGMVRKLVKLMRPEDILIPNSSGDTALHVAIRRDRFDLAMRLFEKHPTTLAIARNEEKLTALHMLARKSPKNLGMDGAGGWLFKNLWTQVNQLEYKRMIDEITNPSPVLFDAIKSGNVEAVQWIIESQPELVRIRDTENGRSLLHLVALFRHKRLFTTILWGLNQHKERAVDNEGNNILHLAAHLPPVEFEEFSSLRAGIQMQRDLAWFKFVDSSFAPDELRTMRNNMSKTPIDVFCDEHKKLSEEIKDAAKGIAESGMLVSTLVATVAFAAALTVPGDKTDAWFTVFILTNAVALFSSSASLLSFLSNFTSSRFAQSEFVISLHPSLTFGRWLLIISVAAMVVDFTAASFLIFDHTSKWVSYVVASMGVFPILLFLLFQINFFDKHLWSRFYRLSKQD